MAYMSQEHKAKLEPTIKTICKKHHIKATLAVRNHSTLVLNVKSGKIDFLRDYKGRSVYNGTIQVNPYHYGNQFDGDAYFFLKEVLPAMYGPDYYNNTDAMTDYFDTSHYVAINIGNKKPYEFTK